MDEKVRRHSENAAQLVQSGRLPHAAAELEKAVRLAPANLSLRQRLGDVYARMGLKTHAIREFQHVAGRYAADGHLLRAIAFCKVILELDPEHTETQRTLAELYAREAADETLPFHPRLPATMSAALDAIPEMPAVPIDFEQLAVFRKAIRHAVAANDEQAGLFDVEEDPTVVRAPKPAAVDIAKLPPIPLFSSLSREAFAALVETLEMRWVNAGETVVAEGDDGDAMFVLVQGAVNVTRRDGTLLAQLREGSFFGEMALVADSRRLATVTAARDLLLLVIDKHALEQIGAKHPEVKKVIERFYQKRLLANVLLVSPVFRPFDATQKRQIGARFRHHSLPPRSVLLEQGKPGAGLCLLLRGKCDVFHVGGRGEEVPLPQMGEGSLFGEISLLLDGPCTATVRTASPCDVLELSRDDFKELVLPHPEVRAMIQKLMSERIGRTAETLEKASAILPDYLV